MGAVITTIAGVVVFVAAASLARPLGRALKGVGVWAQVLAGVVVVMVATALSAYGLSLHDDVWWGVGLGLGFGGLSGLRYGRGTLLDLIGHRETSDGEGARR